MSTFANNLKDGVSYYQNLFSDIKDTFVEAKSIILIELELSKNKLQLISLEIEKSKKI